MTKMKSRYIGSAVAVAIGLFAASLPGCAGGPAPATPATVDLSARRARDAGRGSSDPDEVARWLLDEMLAPGGTPKGADEARARLAKTKSGGMLASFAGAVHDETHGAPRRAAEGYVATLVAAQASEDPLAPLAAWWAAHHLASLRGSVARLWATHETSLARILERPGHVGFRALAELQDWQGTEEVDRADVVGDAYDARVTRRLGCALRARVAGPFGRGTAPERRRAFAAELAPWPATWPEEPTRGSVPRVLRTERHRCLTASTEKTEDGVFYVETFFETDRPRDLLFAVQGAVAVWVDDVQVTARDLRRWGDWQRFGGAARVGKGRHRLLARVLVDAATVRLLELDGRAAGLDTDTDDRKPYGIEKPVLLGDPNPIVRHVALAAEGRPAGGSALEIALVAHAARVDGLNDVASAMMAPLVTPKEAAALALALSAGYARSDVAFPEQVRRINERELHQRATKADPKLWFSRAWLVLDDADSRGLVEAVAPLKALAAELPEVPDPGEQLVRVYGRLGWRAERLQGLRDLVARFPDDKDALSLYAGALEEDGAVAEADKVAARLRQLDPDSEVDLDRALARRDWPAAIAELRRIEKRRPERKEIAARIADVLARAGDPAAAAAQLAKALAKNPDDATVRLRLADHVYATGDVTALRRALAEALSAGSKGIEIREAVELIEGASLLEPYRRDGRKVIKEFEAWEKSGKRMDGTAARILDYAATWVHPDGSSEMLEHEILRMQSQEAVQQEAEQKPPEGLVLRLRVIKPDGSVLEPEPVAGKPTLTMPHLAVGDYLEIEHVTASPSEGGKAKRYRGPHWFFREADKGYWRSEFVVLSPKDRAVEIEQVGKVPAPVTAEKSTFIERRWRVDESPPAPEEPDAPNPREFLPSVRVGWGITLEDMLRRYVDAASEETPLDPRLRDLVASVVKGIPENAREARARALYKYLGENIQDGQDADGRRVLTGRAGSRQAAFLYGCRLLGIPVELAVVKSRVAMPPVGKMSEVEIFDNVALRVELDPAKGPRWMTVRDKFAPFGYVPAELRGQPAFRLVPGTPKDTTDAQGDADGVKIEARAVLREDGSASVEVVHSFLGRMGIGIRSVFDRVAENKRAELVETKLLAQNLPGARLVKLTVDNKDDLAAPLVLRMRAEVPVLARAAGNNLVLRSVFPLGIGQAATLPERQTPMLLANASHVELAFEVVVPESLRLPGSLPSGEVRDGERSVVVKDRVEGRSLVLARVVDVPAGRVQPGAEYARFVAFTRKADEMLEREIAVGR